MSVSRGSQLHSVKFVCPQEVRLELSLHLICRSTPPVQIWNRAACAAGTLPLPLVLLKLLNRAFFGLPVQPFRGLVSMDVLCALRKQLGRGRRLLGRDQHEDFGLFTGTHFGFLWSSLLILMARPSWDSPMTSSGLQMAPGER